MVAPAGGSFQPSGAGPGFRSTERSRRSLSGETLHPGRQRKQSPAPRRESWPGDGERAGPGGPCYADTKLSSHAWGSFPGRVETWPGTFRFAEVLFLFINRRARDSAPGFGTILVVPVAFVNGTGTSVTCFEPAEKWCVPIRNRGVVGIRGGWGYGSRSGSRK